LLQVRDPNDPMIDHEIACFAGALQCGDEQIATFDLLDGCPTPADLNAHDIVLLGGSGDYSVATGGHWLEPALDAMRELHRMAKPTFASCWGFQAMARAMGGTVVTDLDRAEIGTHEVILTDAASNDPLFAALPARFDAHMGHQDVVDVLPAGAVNLVRSERNEHKAFTFPGLPIYGTQFHPELTRMTLLDRLRRYPKYVASLAGTSIEDVERACHDSPETDGLLPRFVEHIIEHHLPRRV
jgi:GMP synthase (glutamine-hydrolysing)